MIEIRSLTKNFGLKPVLRGVDLTIQPGEFLALVGPNGAGKTTLLRIVASLARPTFGRVRLNGFELPSQADAARHLLGVVSHHPLLYGDLTAEENLHFYGEMYSISNSQRRIAEVLEQVGLSKRRGDLVRTFSRGMAQRLAIGRAILHSPQIMLFDEPHTGLDQDASAMLDHILKTVAAQGRTVLMISHDLPHALALADRVAVLSRGKIAYDAPTPGLTPFEFARTYETLTNG
ncbi:MAG TPA: heme ABC exporter ATP-binding protein CcmA [Anaerolineales bacterium]|nr:heme ABC exporter ATP-binding protein CcmA [Anaerolineales bacterium]